MVQVDADGVGQIRDLKAFGYLLQQLHQIEIEAKITFQLLERNRQYMRLMEEVLDATERTHGYASPEAVAQAVESTEEQFRRGGFDAGDDSDLPSISEGPKVSEEDVGSPDMDGGEVSGGEVFEDGDGAEDGVVSSQDRAAAGG